MVSTFFLGVITVYLAIKYGLLTTAKTRVVSAGLVAGPVVLVLLVRLAVSDNLEAFDIGLSILAALPLLWPDRAHPLLAPWAGLLGGLSAIANDEAAGVIAGLFASAATGVAVQLVRTFR